MAGSGSTSVENYERAARAERSRWQRLFLLLHVIAFVAVNAALAVAFGPYVPWQWGIGLLSHLVYALALGDVILRFEQSRIRDRLS